MDETLSEMTSEYFPNLRGAKSTLFLDTLPHFIFCKNLKGIFTYCNQAFADFLKRSKSCVIGLTDYDLVSKEEAERHRHFDRLTLTSGSPVEYDEWITFNNGHSACYCCYKTTYKNAAGEPIGVVGIITEITERQRIQDALHRAKKELTDSQNELQQAQSIANVYSWQATFGENTITLSRPLDLKHNFSCKNKILSYRKILKHLKPSHRRQIKFAIQKSLTSQIPFKVEVTLYSLEKQSNIFLIQGRLKREPGQPIRLYGTAQDISHIRKTEETLHHYKNIVLASTDALALVDKEYRYLAANQKVTDTIQREVGEITDLSVADLVGEPYFTETIKPYMDRCLQGHTVNYQTHYTWSKTEEHYADVRYAPYLDPQGEIAGVAVTSRDITDLKRAEKKLRYYENIVLTSKNLIALFDQDQKLVLANHSFNQTFSLTQQHADLAFKHIVGEQFYDQYLKDFCSSCLSGNDNETLVSFKDHNASTRHTIVRGYPFKEDDGKIKGFQISCQDVTEIEEARDALERYEHIVSASQDFMALIDRDFRYQAVNQSYTKLSHLPREQWIGKTAAEMLGKRYFLNVLKPHYERCLKNETVTFDAYVKFPDVENSQWLEYKLFPHTNRQGKVTGIAVCARDITEKKQNQARLKQLSQAVQHSPAAIMLISPASDIEYVNNQFEKITGYTAEEVIGKPPHFLLHPNTPIDTVNKIEQSLGRGQPCSVELYSQNKSGVPFWEEVTFSPIKEDDGKVQSYLVIREDMTQRKQQESMLLKQAYFDSLTGLPNRLLAKDRLSEAITSAKYKHRFVVLMFIDLDHFKKVNDSMGHGAGDQLLVQTANRLRQCVKDTDTVARLGGDEFIVILPDEDKPTQSRLIAEKILEEIASPFYVLNKKVYIGASIGITAYPTDGETPEDLMRHADTAMYHSKAKGRNRLQFFQPSMNEEAQRRLELENHLRHALERGELTLKYQPQHNAYTKKIECIEALLSWENQKLGKIKTQELISIAEETDLITPIGEWVLETAICQLKSWLNQGMENIKVSVNISPRQVHHTDFIDRVKRIITNHNVPANLLEMEVTETLLMDNLPTTRNTLMELNALGISLAIDDFGKGYSSLSYLKRFPFKKLKIDREFVRDIADDEEDLALTQAIIAMAHALQMVVAAEGVESKDQLALLQTEQCDLIQGFYFSSPQSADSLTPVLITQKA